MLQKTKYLILDLLKAEWDHYQTEIQFMKHQRSLPPEHRKVEIADMSEFSITLFNLELNAEDLESAIKEIQQIPTK